MQYMIASMGERLEPVATDTVSYTHLDVYKRQIQWKVDMVDTPSDELPREGETLRLHFDASRLLLVAK